MSPRSTVIVALLLASVSVSAKKPWSDLIAAWYTSDLHIPPNDRIVDVAKTPAEAADKVELALQAAGAVDVKRERKDEEMRPEVMGDACHQAWKALYDAEAEVLKAPDRKAWSQIDRTSWHIANKCEPVEVVRAPSGFKITATIPDERVLVVPMAEAKARTASALEFRIWGEQDGPSKVYGTGVAVIDGVPLGDPGKKLPLEWFDRIDGTHEARLVGDVLKVVSAKTDGPAE